MITHIAVFFIKHHTKTIKYKIDAFQHNIIHNRNKMDPKVIKNKFTLMSLCSDFIVSNDVLLNNNLHIFRLPPNLEENIKTYIREIKCIETQLKDILLALTLEDILTINGKNVDDDYESGENDWCFLLC